MKQPVLISHHENGWTIEVRSTAVLLAYNVPKKQAAALGGMAVTREKKALGFAPAVLGTAHRFATKEQAQTIAHQLGRYKLGFGDVLTYIEYQDLRPRLYDRGPGHSPRFEPGDDPSLYTVEGNMRRLHENDERIAANASRDRVYRGYFVLWDSLGKKYEIYREEDGKPGRFEQYAESKDHARRIIDAIHGD